MSRGFSETRESNGEMAPEGESTKNPTSGCLQNPQNPRSRSVQVCVQCGAGGDLWHLDTPSGPVLIHEECARFWPGAPPAPPSSGNLPGGQQRPRRYHHRGPNLHAPPGRSLPEGLSASPTEAPGPRPGGSVAAGASRTAGHFFANGASQAESLGWSSADLFGLHQPPEKPHPSYDRLADTTRPA